MSFVVLKYLPTKNMGRRIMSKLTDIKYRIDQLDGGAFQNLCDAYLSVKRNATAYSLGMKTGTNKTAKGNPDTYFLLDNGEYAFVVYTTQKSNFYVKTEKDLIKCFDSDKTGVSPEKVREIVCCHTCGRILPGDIQKLQEICKVHDAIFTLIGLDELGNDLFFKYPKLAKDFLGVSLDTGQITSMGEFVQTHDCNKISAPLSTEFMFREDEIKTAKEKIGLSDVLVITGPAGVGKTRLALHFCKELASESGYEVLCVKSNGLELYEDLVAYIEDDKDYIVLVDDANELTGLRLILNYLSKSSIHTGGIKKIVITVRDYARRKVLTDIYEVEKPEILKVGILKDEDIKKVIESNFGIHNYLYLDRIAAIAEGNARLAMLAGKMVTEKGQLDSIRDATELYEHYYGKQIEMIASNQTWIASAGILSFFRTLRLDNLERLQSVFKDMHLTEDQFISNLKQFHEMELVDLYQDKAVRISDQCFGNYMIKYAFVDRKIIPLNKMIEKCFIINKEKTVSACNILLNVFSNDEVENYVRKQINIVWDNLQSDEDNFFPFFKVFYIVRETESLARIKKIIDSAPAQKFNVQSIVFEKDKNTSVIHDDIIQILCGYKDRSDLPAAIDLLLQYYQKHPDLFKEIYSAFVSSAGFGIDKNSERYGYFTQKTVVERFCAAVESKPVNELLMILFVNVAEQYLRLSFSGTEAGKQNSLICYTISLGANNTVSEYRRNLLETVYSIYQMGKCHHQIEGLLIDYCREPVSSSVFLIVKKELDIVVSFVNQFTPENLSHCLIAEHIRDIAEKAEYTCENNLNPFLNSRKYKIYNILKQDNKRLALGYEEYGLWHKNQVQKLVREYDFQEFQYLLQVCKEHTETVDRETDLADGLKEAIDAFSGKKGMYMEIVKEYMKEDTPCNINPDEIFKNLFKMMPAETVKSLIDSQNFLQKNIWLWYFYVNIPEDEINAYWTDELLKYLENVPDIHYSSGRPLDEIEKFECVDKDIILKASKVLVSHYEESPFVFSLYFSFMTNPYYIEASKVINKYEEDIPLLEEIYLKYISYSPQDDIDGKFLSELIRKDPQFLYQYLDKLMGWEHSFYSRPYEEWTMRLSFIWEGCDSSQCMNEIFKYVLEKAEAREYVCTLIVGYLLRQSGRGGHIAEKQDKWIQDTIENHSTDSRSMRVLFSAIKERSDDFRRNALQRLLKLNDDFELFRLLPLKEQGGAIFGSMTSYWQEKIDYLKSLLPLLSGIAYLKHRQKVERDIEICKELIEKEEIEDLLESLG